MDRVDFTKMLESDTPIEQVIQHHFDELMSLYNILGEYVNFSLSGDFSDLSFGIKFKTKKEAKILHEAMGCEKSVNIYGRQFIWDIQHNDKELLFKIV